MDNTKNDNYYIEKIRQDLEFIIAHTLNTTIEEFSANEILLDSMLFRMIQISENAKYLTQEYKTKRNDVPWNALYGLRNRIVHDYGNVDLNIVFYTLKNDIPELLEMLKDQCIEKAFTQIVEAFCITICRSEYNEGVISFLR